MVAVAADDAGDINFVPTWHCGISSAGGGCICSMGHWRGACGRGGSLVEVLSVVANVVVLVRRLDIEELVQNQKAYAIRQVEEGRARRVVCCPDRVYANALKLGKTPLHSTLRSSHA